MSFYLVSHMLSPTRRKSIFPRTSLKRGNPAAILFQIFASAKLPCQLLLRKPSRRAKKSLFPHAHQRSLYPCHWRENQKAQGSHEFGFPSHQAIVIFWIFLDSPCWIAGLGMRNLPPFSCFAKKGSHKKGDLAFCGSAVYCQRQSPFKFGM